MTYFLRLGHGGLSTQAIVLELEGYDFSVLTGLLATNLEIFIALVIGFGGVITLTTLLLLLPLVPEGVDLPPDALPGLFLLEVALLPVGELEDPSPFSSIIACVFRTIVAIPISYNVYWSYQIKF